MSHSQSFFTPTVRSHLSKISKLSGSLWLILNIQISFIIC